MFEQLLSHFSNSGLVLWGPFIVLVLCGLGFPMPEDIVLVAAGYIGAEYGKPVWMTISVTYFGILIGDGIIFFAGHHIGPRLLKTRVGQWAIHPERLDKVRTYFAKYGVGVVFVGRFLPGLRTAIFFSAGTLKFSRFKFFLMDGFAALISAPVFVYLGHWAFENFSNDIHRLERTLGRTQLYFIVGAVLIALLIFLKLVFKRKDEEV